MFMKALPSIPNIYNISSISSINFNPFKNKPSQGKKKAPPAIPTRVDIAGLRPQLWWFGWCITHELHFQLLLGTSGEFWVRAKSRWMEEIHGIDGFFVDGSLAVSI